MEKIVFDYERLNKDDKKIYDVMNESEKQLFERTWVSIETQKIKLQQFKNKSKERNKREQKVLAEKNRKERTHRLIERGAILESFLTDPESITNEELIGMLSNFFPRNNKPESFESESREASIIS